MFRIRSSAENVASTRKRFEDDIEILRLGVSAAVGTNGGRVTSLLGQSPGAGTTTLAVWLAKSMARASHRTLLVDGNFVNPRLHELFRVDLDPGAVDLFEKRAGADEVVRPTSDAQLTVLPGGKGNGSTLSSSVEQWRSQWRELASDRSLLIDAGSADTPSALTTATASDGVILVVRCGEATRQQIAALQKKLARSNVTLIGIVLNHQRHIVPEWIHRRL